MRRLLPITRGGCASVPRPCPHVGCRHHLYLEVRARKTKRGTPIKYNHPALEHVPPIVGLAADYEPPGPLGLRESCSLDVADDREHTLEEVGELLGLTRERVRQVEALALAKLRKRMANYR